MNEDNTLIRVNDAVTIPSVTSVIPNVLTASQLDNIKSVLVECKVELGDKNIKFPKERTIVEILTTIRKEKLYSDLTIECGGKQYLCHKNILSMHSDVLESMFN